MRALAAAVLIILTLGTSPGRAEKLPPGVTPEEAHAGCMHTDLQPCMISLGTVFWFDMKDVAAQIAIRNERDVNGQTAHRHILINAAIPNHVERAMIRLTLASPTPSDQVIRAELRLPSNPEGAHTPSEYDRTWLYETVSTLLGNKCAGLDRLTLYRFFENNVKSQEKTKTEVIKNGIFNHTRLTIETGKIPFCGVQFSLHGQAEWDGLPDPELPHRSKGNETVIVLE